jgi:hypothetical protein
VSRHSTPICWIEKATDILGVLVLNLALFAMQTDIPKGAARDRAWWIQIGIMFFVGLLIGRSWIRGDELKRERAQHTETP